MTNFRFYVLLYFLTQIFISAHVDYFSMTTINNTTFKKLWETNGDLVTLQEIIDYVYDMEMFKEFEKPKTTDDFYFNLYFEKDSWYLCNYEEFKRLLTEEFKEATGDKLDLYLPHDKIGISIIEKNYFTEYSKYNVALADLLIGKKGEELKKIFDDYALTYKGKIQIGGFILNDFDNLKIDKSKIKPKNIENVKKIFIPIKFELLKHNKDAVEELHLDISPELMEEINQYIDELNTTFRENYYDSGYIFNKNGVFDSKKILKKYSKYIEYLKLYRNTVFLNFKVEKYKYVFTYNGKDIPEEYYEIKSDKINNEYSVESPIITALEILYGIYESENIIIDVFDIYKDGKKCNKNEVLRPGKYVLKIKDEFMKEKSIKRLSSDEIKKYQEEFFKIGEIVTELFRKTFDEPSRKKYKQITPNKKI